MEKRERREGGRQARARVGGLSGSAREKRGFPTDVLSRARSREGQASDWGSPCLAREPGWWVEGVGAGGEGVGRRRAPWEKKKVGGMSRTTRGRAP